MPKRDRCDLCGPYTPEQLAALLNGRCNPEPTGHLCESCAAGVKVAAQAMADFVDARAADFAYRHLDDQALKLPHPWPDWVSRG